MGILSLALALVMEQFHPISNRNRFYLMFIRWTNRLRRVMNAGEQLNGFLAWCVAVLPLAIVSVLVYGLMVRTHFLLGMLWNWVVLYLVMGFRQFSYMFTGISKALQVSDLENARKLLAEWTGQNTAELTYEEIAQRTIEQGVTDSYRYVFATIFWFVALAWMIGPTGALVYRASALLSQKWNGSSHSPFDSPFGYFSKTVLTLMDYIPVRLVGMSFAMVGNFEDAVFCWRSQVDQWIHYDYGVLLASSAGALGVKIGSQVYQVGSAVKYRPELGIGEPANSEHLASAVGLVWRSALLWLLFILLFSIVIWITGIID